MYRFFGFNFFLHFVNLILDFLEHFEQLLNIKNDELLTETLLTVSSFLSLLF